jgi:hypothetical protein
MNGGEFAEGQLPFFVRFEPSRTAVASPDAIADGSAIERPLVYAPLEG